LKLKVASLAEKSRLTFKGIDASLVTALALHLGRPTDRALRNRIHRHLDALFDDALVDAKRDLIRLLMDLVTESVNGSSLVPSDDGFDFALFRERVRLVATASSLRFMVLDLACLVLKWMMSDDATALLCPPADICALVDTLSRLFSSLAADSHLRGNVKKSACRRVEGVLRAIQQRDSGLFATVLESLLKSDTSACLVLGRMISLLDFTSDATKTLAVPLSSSKMSAYAKDGVFAFYVRVVFQSRTRLPGYVLVRFVLTKF
jgi:hypothetical protein